MPRPTGRPASASAPPGAENALAALDYCTGAALLSGQPRHAALLLAASDAARRPHGWGYTRVKLYQYAVDTARAALGDAAFAVAWEEGSALSVDAAIALALEVTAEPETTTDAGR